MLHSTRINFQSGLRIHGFTLIELLVVISIISVLMALLMPALSQARASAKGTMCATNMKQVHLAMSTYSNDHQQRLMANRQYVSAGQLVNGTWPGRFPTAGGYGMVPWQGSLVGDNGYATRKLFIDPATSWSDATYEEVPGGPDQPIGSQDGPFWWANYGVNDKGVFNAPLAPVGANPPVPVKLKKIDSIRKTAEVMGIIDSGLYTINNADPNVHKNATYVPGYKWTWSFTGAGTAMNDVRRIDANQGRHPNRSVEVLYMDGHVKPMIPQYELTISATAVFWTGL